VCVCVCTRVCTCTCVHIQRQRFALAEAKTTNGRPVFWGKMKSLSSPFFRNSTQMCSSHDGGTLRGCVVSPSILFFAPAQQEECPDPPDRSRYSRGHFLVGRAAMTQNQEPGQLLPFQLPTLLSEFPSSYCLRLENI